MTGSNLPAYHVFHGLYFSIEGNIKQEDGDGPCQNPHLPAAPWVKRGKLFMARMGGGSLRSAGDDCSLGTTRYPPNIASSRSTLRHKHQFNELASNQIYNSTRNSSP